MSVQRWELTDRYGEDAISERSENGWWVTFSDHAAEVARLTAEIEESRKLHASALRVIDACSDWAFQRDRHNEEVARLRGALEAMTAKVKEAHVALGADGGITEIECSCEFCSEVPR